MKLFNRDGQNKWLSGAADNGSHQTSQGRANQSVRRPWPRSIGTTLGLTSVILLLTATACQAAKPEGTFAPATATFAPCPDSPNCVSSQADPSDDVHYMAALPYSGSAVDAKEKLWAIVKALPRTTIVTEQERYLHVEFRSRIFRFVDDVEFYIDEETNLIHFRSASRLGYSDMGVNRKRMENIRDQFVQ